MAASSKLMHKVFKDASQFLKVGCRLQAQNVICRHASHFTYFKDEPLKEFGKITFKYIKTEKMDSLMHILLYVKKRKKKTLFYWK